MSSSALREILVSFGIDFDTKDLEQGIHETEGGLNSLIEIGSKLAHAWEEVALVEVVKSWVEAVVQGSVELLHASERIGLSAEQLKFWRFAGQLAGVEAGQLDTALQRLSRSIGTPGPEAQALAGVFTKLGVKTKDAHGNVRTLDEVLPDIVANFGKLKEGPEQTAAAMQLFGRAGATLVPFLRQGADGLAKLNAEFIKLGGEVNEETLENAERFEQSQIKLGVVWKALRGSAVSWLLPMLGKLSDIAIDLSVQFRAWAKETDILKTAIKTGLVYSLYILIPLVWSLVSPLLATLAAFAALVLLVDDFKTAWEGGDSFIGRIIDKVFGPGTTAKIVAWIKNAVATVEGWWEKLDFSAVLDKFGDLLVEISDLFGDSTKTSQEKFEILLGYIGGAFRDAMHNLLGDTAGDVVTEFVGAITEVISAFKELWDIASTILHAIADIITATVGPAIAFVSDALANLQAKDERRGTDEGNAQAKVVTSEPLPAGFVQDFFGPKGAPPPTGAASTVAPSFFGGPPPDASAPPLAPVVNMNVSVAPGTPAQQARALGKAGADGAKAGLSAPNRAAAKGLERSK